jgi:hypothetical protein
MELKQTERKVDELIVLYQATRQALQALESKACILPEVAPRVGSEDSAIAIAADTDAVKEASATSDTNNNTATAVVLSLAELVTQLVETIPRALHDELLPILDKFRQRLAEKDAVTGNSRYGEKTQTRVTALVAAYDALSQAMPNMSIPMPPTPPTSSSISSSSSSQGHCNSTLEFFLMELQSKVQQEQQEQERVEKEQEDKIRQEQERLENEAEQGRLEKEQHEQRKQQEEQERIARENEIFRQRAEQARRQRAEQQAAEDAWVASIRKSPDGVKEQLEVLKQSAASSDNDPGAQKVALSALLQLFQQINAHPEETNYRRIRRDHEKFHQDIGRHKGGREILIAAGFELGAIDEVPCFISKEPDIENDMDGWSAWFDLLKATLKIVEENQC